MVVLQLVMDLMIMMGSEDRKRSQLVVFDSLMSLSFCMPCRIETTVYALVEPVMIRFHTDDDLREVVQDMMQLQMTSYVE